MKIGNEEVIVLSGIWQSANIFITDDGEVVKVSPYFYILDKYGPLLPMPCIIQITDRAITDVMPVDEKFEGIEYE